jgi:hypothetical protein
MRALFLSVILASCSDGNDSGTPTDDSGVPIDDSGTDDCESCLRAGLTWQPEIESCTEDCSYQDISCYRDECPGSCADDCGFCFSSGECEANGCTWQSSNEAQWCTG